MLKHWSDDTQHKKTLGTASRKDAMALCR